MANNNNNGSRICSFCGKDEKQVSRIIYGPDGINICSNCVMLCEGLLEELEMEDERNAGKTPGQ